MTVLQLIILGLCALFMAMGYQMGKQDGLREGRVQGRIALRREYDKAGR